MCGRCRTISSRSASSSAKVNLWGFVKLLDLVLDMIQVPFGKKIGGIHPWLHSTERKQVPIVTRKSDLRAGILQRDLTVVGEAENSTLAEV